MTKLDPKIEDRIQVAYRSLMARGDLMPPDMLRAAYSAFRDRFGPDRLSKLDGEPLLMAMFAHGNRESLVYWLEFKNDEEFPSPRFGSIAGGSAHKFGLFRRKETGQWVTGSPQTERAVTIAEAVELARIRRNQLVRALSLLDTFPKDADDNTYLSLQNRLSEVAPDVAGLAWGHKYFSLFYPDILDDYHNHKWQRFNLIKLLQLPPEADGLYTCAGHYSRLAQNFEWPMNHLTTVLTEVNGAPKTYWCIGTRLGEGPDAEDIWPAMRDGGFAAIGWDWIGDLSEEIENSDLKDIIFERLGSDHYPEKNVRSRKAGEIRNFTQRVGKGDVILAAIGENILGVGIATGDYRFEETPPASAPHRFDVDWLSVNPWSMPIADGLRTTFVASKHEANWIEAERQLLEATNVPIPKPKPVAVSRPKLDGVSGQVQAILERKGQVILYGPPGTGKTYWARAAAKDLAALSAFGKFYADLADAEARQVDGSADEPGLVRMCTFHPAYGYEDFIEGYRPETNGAGALTFRQRDGIFKRLCLDAAKAPDKRQFFLLIDEINRGDIPRIFGELLTLLENDKRGMELSLPVSGRSFAVPENVRVIGTMNTADRSIALLDTALRRRFGFVELLPDTHLFGGAMVGDAIPLGPWLAALNGRIREHLGRDARNLQIGHAYFLHAGTPVTDLPKFVRILAEDVIPLLQEYCYEDFGLLEKLLGEGLVDGATQIIRSALFDPANHEFLIQALLEPCPEIVTSSEAKSAVGADEDAATDES